MLMLHLGTHEIEKEDLVIETFGFDNCYSRSTAFSVYGGVCTQFISGSKDFVGGTGAHC